ncbi:MAG TPA: nitroreductase [Anaerolineaceae bacterium]|nr:nitroreductase [Anaerolineaceae bacterium]
MDIYQAFQNRQTIRDFEQTNGVPRMLDPALVNKLIQAGFSAPTNDHMRDWHFVLLNDLEKRSQLVSEVVSPISQKRAENIINRWGLTDAVQREMYLQGIPRQFSMLNNCGCLILPLYRQDLPLLKPKNLSALNYFVSIWLCIENIFNAASAEGVYGVVRIPAPEESKIVKTRLNIPANYEFPCWIALGYPAPDTQRARQVSIDIDTRIHQNQW